MSQAPDRSDAYQASREAALGWLSANWDPGRTVRAWWALLAESGWGFPTWPEAWFGKGLSADAAAGVRSAFAETGALPPPVGLGQPRTDRDVPFKDLTVGTQRKNPPSA